MPPETTDNLSDLPLQVLFEVATYLSLREVIILAQLSKKLREAIQQNAIWQYLLKRDLSSILDLGFELKIDRSQTNKKDEYAIWYRYFKQTLLPFQDQEIAIFKIREQKLYAQRICEMYPGYRANLKNLLFVFLHRETFLDREHDALVIHQTCGLLKQSDTMDLIGLSRIPLYLKRLPQWKHDMVREINLSRSGILRITPALFVFKGLTDLDLCDNHLSYIPEAIQTLSELKHLVLRNNALSAFPKAVLSLSKLKVLDLSNVDIKDNKIGNVIHDIPDEIEKLKDLSWLDMINVQLKNININLMNLNSLNHLDLSHNDICESPELFLNLLDERHVDINLIGNPIQTTLSSNKL